MKKIISVISLFLGLLIIVRIFAEANPSVYIERAELIDKTNSTTELSDPNIDGLGINFNLQFVELNDYARYKITIKNTTDKDYELSNESNFTNSEFLKYEYEFDNNNKVISANSTKTLFIKIIYNKPVSDSSYDENGTYIEEKEMKVELSIPEVNETNTTEEINIVNETNETENAPQEIKNETNETITNPKTGPKGTIFLALGVLLVALAISIIITDYKPIKETFVIIGLLLIIPISIHAIEKLSLTVNTHVEITKSYEIEYYFLGTYIYTEEQYNDIRYNYPNDCSEINVGEDKYYGCSGVTYKDSKKYAAKSRISFNNPAPKHFEGSYRYDCQGIRSINMAYICPENSTIYDYDFYNYLYSSEFSKPDFPVLSEDIETMNFSSIRVDNSAGNEIDIKLGNNTMFTMPNHNVIIAIWEDRAK